MPQRPNILPQMLAGVRKMLIFAPNKTRIMSDEKKTGAAPAPVSTPAKPAARPATAPMLPPTPLVRKPGAILETSSGKLWIASAAVLWAMDSRPGVRLQLQGRETPIVAQGLALADFLTAMGLD